MHTRFIDQFDVVLLDVSHTFMFDVDRFSDTEDYGATYRQIGGNLLSNGEVRRTISALFDSMLADYEDPNCYDSFLPVFSCLKVLPESKDLPVGEIQLLARVLRCTRLEQFRPRMHRLCTDSTRRIDWELYRIFGLQTTFICVNLRELGSVTCSMLLFFLQIIAALNLLDISLQKQ